MEEPRPRVWPAFAAYAVLLCVIGLSQLALIAAVAMHLARTQGVAAVDVTQVLQGTPLAAKVWLLSMTLAAGGEIAVALVAGRPWKERLRLGAGQSPLRYALVVGLLSFAAAEGVALGVDWIGHDPLSARVLDSLTDLSQQPRAMLPLVWLQAVLLSPFAEELFFRGFLQTRFVARWGGLTGVVLSSAFFGLTHFSPVQSANAFVLGLLYGWSALRSRSIWPGFVAHVGVNALSMALMRLAGSDSETGGKAALLRTLAVIGVTAALGMGVELVARRRERAS